jgi:hypothetical protein
MSMLEALLQWATLDHPQRLDPADFSFSDNSSPLVPFPSWHPCRVMVAGLCLNAFHRKLQVDAQQRPSGFFTIASRWQWSELIQPSPMPESLDRPSFALALITALSHLEPRTTAEFHRIHGLFTWLSHKAVFSETLYSQWTSLHGVLAIFNRHVRFFLPDGVKYL